MAKDKLQTFDLLIIGSGSGLNLIPEGLKVAVVERGKLGGTCLNRGCIPSKILLHSADVAETINNSKKFGINSKIISVDFSGIVKRANKITDESSAKIEAGLKNSKDITLFKGNAVFVDKKTVKVGNNLIKADKVIIATGARPSLPDIPGLENVNYITSMGALRLANQPKSITILGGGYIAAEFAHFYGALGTKVNVIQRSKNLLSKQDEEIAEMFTKEFKKKYNVYTNTEIIKTYQKGNKKYVDIKTNSGKKTVSSEVLLVVMGIAPNSEMNLEKTGVKTDKQGYIITNEYYETTAKNIWALGDVISGTTGLKHGANYDSDVVFQNAILGKKVKRDYSAMPFAVFSSPQVAGVGATEQELKSRGIEYTKGTYLYSKTGQGLALQEEGFVKIMVNPRTKKILGCHIMGADASNIVQEVVFAMHNNLSADDILRTIHIHPALSEVIQRAAGSI